MTPFNFLGQDTGSLFAAYSGIVFDGRPSPASFVILYDQNGNPILTYGYPLGIAPIAESSNYSLNVSGDFLGVADDFNFVSSIKSGEVYGVTREEMGFVSFLSGSSPPILVDVPNYQVTFSGSANSGIRDNFNYFFQLSSGEASGILLDRFNFSAALNQISASGILIDLSSLKILINGKLNKIYKESASTKFSFYAGAISKGAILSTLTTGDLINLAFSFDNGKVYASKAG
jgi:hypothetical protein